MKTTFKKSFLLLAALSFLAVGCGKDGGGGGGGSSANYYSASNLTGTNLTYMNEVRAWYSAAEKTNLRRYGVVTSPINVTSSGSSSSCAGEIKEYLGGLIKVCVYSTSSSSSSSSSGATVVYNLVGVGTNNNINNPQICVTTNGTNCSEAAVTYSGKGNNVALKEALSGKNNTLFLLSVTKLSTTVYQLAYARSSLETVPSVIYKIDTSLHSLYNPVETTDISALSQKYIFFY